MSELKGKSSQHIYAGAHVGFVVFQTGHIGNISLRAEKGKSLQDNKFLASNNSKFSSNDSIRASNH